MTGEKLLNPEDWFSSLTNEILAESYLSYNPGQRHHLGKIILKAMRRHPSDAVLQIDVNGEEESVGSVLDRSIDTAKALCRSGVRTGDVVAVMGRNHLDISIPFYASLFVGAAFMGLDSELKIDELKSMLNIGKPKLVICDVDNLILVLKVKEEFGFEVVVFGKSEGFMSFSEFHRKQESDEPNSVFRVSQFDPEKTTAILASTSGSTGPPKVADITHANLSPYLPLVWTSGLSDFRSQSRLVLTLSPLHWLPSATLLLQSAVFCVRRVQTSAPLSSGHFAEIINKYKPSWVAMSPAMASNLLQASIPVDWTCLETLGLWGAPVSDDLISNLNKLIGKNAAVVGYGLTEASGRVFHSSEGQSSLGVPLPHVEVKLVDPESTQEVFGPGTGELFLKGPSIFRGYYNDTASSAELFPDGWLRTGDILRRDARGQFTFVETLGTNFKYGDRQVSATEIESLLRRLEGVVDAAVVGVERGVGDALPLACVVAAPAHSLTVASVLDYVKESLSDPKQFRGGVIFVESLPLTSSGKLDRRRLRELAADHYAATDNNVLRSDGIERIRYTNEVVTRKGIFCCCV